MSFLKWKDWALVILNNPYQKSTPIGKICYKIYPPTRCAAFLEVIRKTWNMIIKCNI